MRLWLTYLSILIAGIGTVILLFSFSTNPEIQIVGEWNEIVWAYDQKEMPSSKRTESSGFLIHEAEVWTFLPDGRLLLEGDSSTSEALWSLKGRGHILQLKYDNDYIENYNIDVLDNNELVLNFEDGLEVRGLSKLTFSRLKR